MDVVDMVKKANDINIILKNNNTRYRIGIRKG